MNAACFSRLGLGLLLLGPLAGQNITTVRVTTGGQTRELTITHQPPIDPTVDSDRDRLPDAWELQHFGHLGAQPDADDDNDGATNLQEYLAGTNPTVPAFDPADTDGDGLPDAWERRYLGTLQFGPADQFNDMDRTLGEYFQQGRVPYLETPVVAAGLRAWFGPASMVDTDPSLGGLALWSDLSGNGLHLRQAATASQPFLISAETGERFVYFTGFESMSATSAHVLAGGHDLTVFAVLRPDSGQGAAASAVALGHGTDDGFRLRRLDAAGAPYALVWPREPDKATQGSAAAVPTFEGEVHLLVFAKAGATQSGFLNGVEVSSSAVANLLRSLPASLNVGGFGGAEAFAGALHEVLVYNRALSPAEREAVEDRLLARHNLADRDRNGLPDRWERRHFGHTGVDPQADPDGDGVSNREEYVFGLDPNRADTDGDGYDDGMELGLGTDPADPNSKGVAQITWLSRSTFTVFTGGGVQYAPGLAGFLPNSTKSYKKLVVHQTVTEDVPPGIPEGWWQPSPDLGSRTFIAEYDPDVPDNWRISGQRVRLTGNPDPEQTPTFPMNGIWHSRTNPPAGAETDTSLHVSSQYIAHPAYLSSVDVLITVTKDFTLSDSDEATEVPPQPESVTSGWITGPPVASRSATNSVETVYHLLVPPGTTGTLRWLEIFTPEANPADKAYTARKWTIDGEKSPLFTLSAPVNGSAKVALQAFSPGLYVDANRDGEIRTDGSDTTTPAQPFRFWINDDDDGGDTGGSDIPGDGTSDFSTGIAGPPGLGSSFGVDGNRDLIDWFPVFLDIKQLITVLPPGASVQYRLKHEGNALSFVQTDLTRERALAYQKERLATGFGFNFDRAPGEAQATQITAAGAVLSEEFLTRIRDQNAGVILVEAGAATDQPLVLAVEKDGAIVAEAKLELRISPVEQMFRHLNLRDGPDAPQGNDSNGQPLLTGETGSGHAAMPTAMTEPPAYPDGSDDPRWLFFVHGYNVSGQKARGWNAEMFKRFYWSRSKARFVGVTWFGNPSTGNANVVQRYHWAVRNAVPTAQQLAAKVNALPGGKTVVGHSQGSWVAAVAVADFGMNVDRLCLLNAAFARECFDGDDATDMASMVPAFWQDYPAWSWSANWHQVFPSGDARSALTWRARLAPALGRTAVHSFYSSTEDVLEKHSGTPTLAVVENAFRTVANLDAAELGRFAWVCQEKTKGDKALFTQGSGYGGWGFNLHDGLLPEHPKWYVPDLSQPVRRPKTPEEIGPVTPAPSERLRHNPVFRTGWGYYDAQNPARIIVETSPIYNTGPEWILELYQTATGPATGATHRNQLLAEAIPALSLPVGANETTALEENNYDMPQHFANRATWPRGNKEGTQTLEWRHSDIREVAFVYMHELFAELSKLTQ